jgi:hypothetical protein
VNSLSLNLLMLGALMYIHRFVVLGIPSTNVGENGLGFPTKVSLGKNVEHIRRKYLMIL